MKILEHMTVAGFKSIRELRKLEMRNLNILVGGNGAGKTNLLSVFKLLNCLVDGRLQLHVALSGGVDSFMPFDGRTPIEIELGLELKDGNDRSGYEVTLTPTAGGSLEITKERWWLNGCAKRPKPGTGPTIRNQEESRLLQMAHEDKAAYHICNTLLYWDLYHFHDTGETARVKKTQDLHDNRNLRRDASNLAPFLYLLSDKNPDHYRAIIETIRLAAPFFDDFDLRPTPANPDKITLKWRDKQSARPLDASYLSDGTLRFICLATVLMQPQLPALLIIDEPELGLHPYAINLLADLLQRAATKTQVVISTQSVPLVNQFQPEDLIVVDREDNEQVYQRLKSEDLKEWLKAYSLGELWEKNVIGERT